MKASARTRVAISKSPRTLSVIIGETGPRAAPLVETVIERLNMDMGGLPRGECECCNEIHRGKSCHGRVVPVLKMVQSEALEGPRIHATQNERRLEDCRSLAPHYWIERLRFSCGSIDPRVLPRSLQAPARGWSLIPRPHCIEISTD